MEAQKPPSDWRDFMVDVWQCLNELNIHSRRMMQLENSIFDRALVEYAAGRTSREVFKARCLHVADNNRSLYRTADEPPIPWDEEAVKLLDSKSTNPYELPLGSTLIIGKRAWLFVRRMGTHPDMMRFREVTKDELEPIPRLMYPSEVEVLLKAGFKVIPPFGTDANKG